MRFKHSLSKGEEMNIKRKIIFFIGILITVYGGLAMIVYIDGFLSGIGYLKYPYMFENSLQSFVRYLFSIIIGIILIRRFKSKRISQKV